MTRNTKTRCLPIATLGLAAALLAANAHAVGLVYLDADDDFSGGGANANIAPLSAFDTSGLVDRNDGLWHVRDGFGFEGPEFNFVWEATGNVGEGDTGEDVQEITQTISGLTPGASYKAYAVYWATAESWVIRAGTSSGDLTLYDAFGVQPDATAGVPAASAIWDTPPTIEGAPAFTEDNRTAYLGLAGTVEADGAGEAQVYIDDLPGDSSATRTWFDGVAYLPAEFDISPTAAIDRDTGELTISNNTGAPISFTSISLTSASQALDASSWLSISDNYDEGVDGGVDDDAWEVTAPLDSPLPAFTGELSEMESEGGADGATLADGASIDLGAVWRDTRFEDVEDVVFSLASGTTLAVPVMYTGTEHLLGDFSNDGAVGLEDYESFSQNLHTDIAGLSQAEAYLLGDMNGDILINHADFVAFRDAYDAANGAGAFAAAITVPEPGGLALVAGWLCALLGLGRRGRRAALAPVPAPVRNDAPQNPSPRASTMPTGLRLRTFCYAALVCGVASLCARPADAQLTYVDADATAGTGNTTPSSAFLAGSDNSADDDLWSLRTGFASGGSIYESGQGDGEDAPEISTVIDGLTPDALYSVYVHFWDGSGGDPDWNVRAGFASGDTTLFANGVDSDADDLGAVGAGLASDLDYATAPTVFAEADRTMYAGLLGPAKADSSGELRVFVDDLPSTIGVNQRAWYDGLSFEPATVLSLRVASNGQVSIVNDNSAADFDINYYEVRSPSGALDVGGWSSIDGEGPAGETTWEKAGGSSASLISETNLLGMESLAPSSSVSLGGAYAGSQEDLEFYYGLADGDGQLLRGLVEFVTVEGLPGDFNEDSVVDAADYAVWRDNLGRSVALPNDNGIGTPVGSQHYDLWRSNYGSTSASIGAAQSAPEPGGVGLLAAAAMSFVLRQGRTRRGVRRGEAR